MGEAIILCSSDAMREEVTERYIKGEPENIYSKLAVEPVLRTYLLSLISLIFFKIFTSFSKPTISISQLGFDFSAMSTASALL